MCTRLERNLVSKIDGHYVEALGALISDFQALPYKTLSLLTTEAFADFLPGIQFDCSCCSTYCRPFKLVMTECGETERSFSWGDMVEMVFDG